MHDTTEPFMIVLLNTSTWISVSEYILLVSLPDLLSHLLTDLQIPTDYNCKIYGFLSHSLTSNLIPRLLSTCHIHHKCCTTDHENILPPFLDAMRDNAEALQQEPADDVLCLRKEV